MIVGLLIVGVLLISSGLKGTEHELGQQLAGDMLGTQGFIGWIAAIAVIGGLGYIPTLETPSRYLLALLLVVIVLRNGGVFQQAQQAIQSAAFQGPAHSVQTLPTSIDAPNAGGSGGGKSSSSGGGALGAIGQVAGAVGGLLAFL